MLMAPGPSSWAAEATVSRSLVRPDRIIGPEVHRRAAAASDEATEQHEIKCSTSAVHCHTTYHKILNLLSQ